MPKKSSIHLPWSCPQCPPSPAQFLLQRATSAKRDLPAIDPAILFFNEWNLGRGTKVQAQPRFLVFSLSLASPLFLSFSLFLRSTTGYFSRAFVVFLSINSVLCKILTEIFKLRYLKGDIIIWGEVHLEAPGRLAVFPLGDVPEKRTRGGGGVTLPYLCRSTGYGFQGRTFRYGKWKTR